MILAEHFNACPHLNYVVMFSGEVEKDRHILYLVMIKLIKQRHNRSHIYW